MSDRTYRVGRHPLSGWWAVYRVKKDGGIEWIDTGWRDSADAELQAAALEVRQPPQTGDARHG